MSSYNTLSGSTFVPNEEQRQLIEEHERRYGSVYDLLPDGVENTDPEYVDLFVRMRKAGFQPSSHGWVSNDEVYWRR